MSRKANPWDNAACESFMKTLKYEEVSATNIAIWPRPARHWHVPGEGLQPKTAALGARLLAPGGVRTQTQGGRCAAASLMSFLRHGEIYRFDAGASPAANAPAHRLDEFPAGYSLAGCSPAEPASASPAGDHFALKSSCRSILFHRTANSVLTVCVSRGGKRSPPVLKSVKSTWTTGTRKILHTP